MNAVAKAPNFLKQFDRSAKQPPVICDSKILEHREAGYTRNIRRVELWFPWQDGLRTLVQVREASRDKPVLNKHSLDALIWQSHKLPSDWYEHAIGFIGTIYETCRRPYFLSTHYWPGQNHWPVEEEWLDGGATKLNTCHPGLGIALMKF